VNQISSCQPEPHEDKEDNLEDRVSGPLDVGVPDAADNMETSPEAVEMQDCNLPGERTSAEMSAGSQRRTVLARLIEMCAAAEHFTEQQLVTLFEGGIADPLMELAERLQTHGIGITVTQARKLLYTHPQAAQAGVTSVQRRDRVLAQYEVRIKKLRQDMEDEEKEFGAMRNEDGTWRVDDPTRAQALQLLWGRQRLFQALLVFPSLTTEDDCRLMHESGLGFVQDPLYAEAKQIIGDLEVWKYGHMLKKHAQLREAQEEMTPPPTSIEAEKWILQLTPCLSPQCQRPLGSYSVGGRCCDVCGKGELRHSQI
jgi:hypothetical protein